MKISFYIAAVAMATMMLAGMAMAGTVDIGLGRMSQTEFDTLKQMVSGTYRASDSVSTVKPQVGRVAEFNQADVDAIRQVMVAGRSGQDSTESAASRGTVDIGTGTMATGEFCDLNKLVASNHTNPEKGFTFICP